MTSLRFWPQSQPGKLRAEVAAIWSLAWPSLLSYLSLVGMSIVDLVFIGHLGKTQLAAASLAVLWLDCTALSAKGIHDTVGSLVAQAVGAGNQDRVGLVVLRGAFFAVLYAMPLTLSWLMTEPLLLALRQDPHLAYLAGRYARTLALAAPSITLFNVSGRSLIGQGIVKPITVVNVVANVVNVALNQLLIHGAGSWAGMGFDGAPWATVISRWFLLAMISVYLHVNGYYRLYAAAASWKVFDPAGIREFIGLAFASSFQVCTEAWGFNATTVLIGYLGIVALDVHTILMNILILLWVWGFAFSIAASQRVGFHLGAGDPDTAHSSAVATLSIGAAVQVTVALLTFLFRHRIGGVFSDDPVVIDGVQVLVPLFALMTIADGIQATQQGVLRGMARPVTATVANLVGYYVIGLPLGIYLAFPARMRLSGMWLGVAVGIAVVMLINAAYLWRVDWSDEARRAVLRSSEKVFGANSTAPYAVVATSEDAEELVAVKRFSIQDDLSDDDDDDDDDASKARDDLSRVSPNSHSVLV